MTLNLFWRSESAWCKYRPKFAQVFLVQTVHYLCSVRRFVPVHLQSSLTQPSKVVVIIFWRADVAKSVLLSQLYVYFAIWQCLGRALRFTSKRRILKTIFTRFANSLVPVLVTWYITSCEVTFGHLQQYNYIKCRDARRFKMLSWLGQPRLICGITWLLAVAQVRPVGDWWLTLWCSNCFV